MTLYMYNIGEMKEDSKTHIELAGTVTLGPKGQVVIPVDVREKMGVKPGDKLVALYIPDKESIGFVTEAKLQYLVDKMGSHLSHIRSMINQESPRAGK